MVPHLEGVRRSCQGSMWKGDVVCKGSESTALNNRSHVSCSAESHQKSFDSGLLSYHPSKKILGEGEGVLRGCSLLRRGLLMMHDPSLQKCRVV